MTKNNYIATLLLATLYINSVMAQNNTQIPKLVVTIAVDQLRSDYMQAFSSLYCEGGFNKLLSEGKVYEKAINDFTPVDRASALATLSSGAIPYYNGIVASSWLDRNTLRPIGCIDDKKKTASTSAVTSAGKLLVSTIGDELKIYTQGVAKVFSVAPNADEAILSIGHAADCAYWIDDNTGRWTSTDYYPLSNASWVRTFEQIHSIPAKVKSYKWEPFTEITGNVSFFMDRGTTKPFSHSFTGVRQYVDFKNSALVNSEITEMAIQCVKSNSMGLDHITDLLSLTYYAGLYKEGTLTDCHRELQDTYFRLDYDLSRLIEEIDKQVGAGRVLYVLTSTGYSTTTTDDYAKLRIPSGTFYINRTSGLLNMFLSAIFGQAQYVDGIYRNHIYLNHKLLEQKHISLTDMLTRSREFLMLSEGVRDVYTAERILSPDNADVAKIRNAYNPNLCGDIIIEVAPGWKIVNEDSGESFSLSATPNVFPIIFYGPNVVKGTVHELVTTDCIAPTICKNIRIRAPNACRSLPLF